MRQVRLFLKQWLTRGLGGLGYQLVNIRKGHALDGLYTVHNAPFLDDERFQSAYRRGVQASGGVDPGTQWRIHVGLWAAHAASRIAGDFVECGVNAGFLSSAILHYLGGPGAGRKFYLVDTFEGPALEQFSEEELGRGRLQIALQAIEAGAYVTDLARVRQNYSEWSGVEIVKGCVPDVLPEVMTERVAFLHLDMNCSFPETAALRYFWDRISPGGIVLFDDYTYFGHDAQTRAIGELASALGAEALAIPTGQGLLIKA
jgi:hypothetical protein